MELESKIVPIDQPKFVKGNPLVLVRFAEPVTTQDIGIEPPKRTVAEEKAYSILDVGFTTSLMFVLIAMTVIAKREGIWFPRT